MLEVINPLLLLAANVVCYVKKMTSLKMIKSGYIIFTILILLGCNKPDKKKNNIVRLGRDCKWGQAEFADDKKYGLQLIRYGLPTETDDYFWSILENDYHITIKFNLDCMIDKGVECYNDSMSSEIKKIYGKDFFVKVHRQVDSIYKIDKPLIDKVKELKFVDSASLQFSVFNTPNNRVKVVAGYSWREYNKKVLKITNLFRISIDRFSLKIINIDTTNYEVSPMGYK